MQICGVLEYPRSWLVERRLIKQRGKNAQWVIVIQRRGILMRADWRLRLASKI